MTETAEAVTEKITALKAELNERRKSLPAHSIRPQQMLILEELEDKIAQLEVLLAEK